ncbi:hypothetical protein ACJX0J_038715, partial [Zea mays]
MHGLLSKHYKIIHICTPDQRRGGGGGGGTSGSLREDLEFTSHHSAYKKKLTTICAGFLKQFMCFGFVSIAFVTLASGPMNGPHYIKQQVA